MNVENREVNPKLIDNINELKTAINEISVYDLNTYTAIELYYRIANKLNEVIQELLRYEIVVSEQVVEQNQCLQYLLNEGLTEEVIKKINSMVEDGTMDTIINHNVFNSLNNRIEGLENLINKVVSIRQFPKLETDVDDTERFQRAINYILSSNRGYKLLLDSETYTIDGTIKINPSHETVLNQVPLIIEGQCEKTQFGTTQSNENGTTIVRNVAGDIFKVNLNDDNVATIQTNAQWFSFGFRNISVVGKTFGIVVLNMFRVRSLIENISVYNVDYLIKQDYEDANGNPNYCDMSIYRNLSIEQSTKHFLKLARPDASLIQSVFAEKPTANCTNVLEINGGVSFKISNILSSMNDLVNKSLNNSVIRIYQAYNFEITNYHFERCHFKYAMNLEESRNGEIKNGYIRFNYNTIFNLKSVSNLNFKNLYVRGTQNTDVTEYDAIFSTYCNNCSFTDIILRNEDSTRRPFVKSGGCANLTGKLLHLRVYFTGTGWEIVDRNNTSCVSYLGNFEWDSDGLKFKDDSLLKSHLGFSCSPRCSQYNTMPYLPVNYVDQKVYFFNYTTQAKVTTPDTNMDFNLIMNIIV